MVKFPSRNRVQQLVIFIGLFWAVGIAVFFAYIIGLAYAQGGEIMLNMTIFNEQTVEYWLMIGLVPVMTLALFYTIESLPE